MKNKQFPSKCSFLSIQTKKALFYSIQEAKNNKTNVLTSKFIFYGILKANPSLLSNIFNKISEKNEFLTDDINNFIYKCKLSLKNESSSASSADESKKIILSKSARDLYKSLLINLTKANYSANLKGKYNIITTFSIFNELLKSESIKTWFRDEIFLPKK